MKKMMALILAGVMTFSATAVSAPQRVEADEYSIDEYGIDESKYNIQWDAQRRYVNVYEKFQGKQTNQLVGACRVKLGLARKKGTNDYVLVTKQEMTPRRFTHLVATDYHGQRVECEAYGLSEYLSIHTVVPTMTNYSPTNSSQSNSSIGISFGAGADGLNMGVSYEAQKNYLDITVNSSTYTNILDVVYDYRPRMKTKQPYLMNQSFQYSMAAFTQKTPYWKQDGSVSFTVEYDARFGFCRSKSGNWLDIDWGLVYAKKQSELYSFVLPKR